MVERQARRSRLFSVSTFKAAGVSALEQDSETDKENDANVDLLKRLLSEDPLKRPTAKETMQDAWIKQENPLLDENRSTITQFAAETR